MRVNLKNARAHLKNAGNFQECSKLLLTHPDAMLNDQN